MSFAAIGRIAGAGLRSGTTFSRAGFAASGTLSTSSARAVGKAAEKSSFFQRADQAVAALFRLEAERPLPLLARGRSLKRGVVGQCVSVRVDLGCRSTIKKKKKKK